MSDPHSLALDQPLDVHAAKIIAHSINTGVPHAVVFVEDLEGGGRARARLGAAASPAFRARGART